MQHSPWSCQHWNDRGGNGSISALLLILIEFTVQTVQKHNGWMVFCSSQNAIPKCQVDLTSWHCIHLDQSEKIESWSDDSRHVFFILCVL